jgi:hypothetical protein
MEEKQKKLRTTTAYGSSFYLFYGSGKLLGACKGLL